MEWTAWEGGGRPEKGWGGGGRYEQAEYNGGWLWSSMLMSLSVATGVADWVCSTCAVRVAGRVRLRVSREVVGGGEGARGGFGSVLTIDPSLLWFGLG
jgi:hypothetical protein